MKPSNSNRWLRRPPWPRFLAGLLLAGLLGGCATVEHPNPADPFESYNRAMTDVNRAIDNALIKPVATVYKAATPQIARTGVTNFFGNLGDVWSGANSLMQGNVTQALTSFWRVVINTTLGLGGVFDPATEMHLQRSRQDFGLTLGHWGFGPGPFLVLPILGPSTVRDTLALPADWYGYLPSHIDQVSTRYIVTGFNLINTRANLLGTLTILDQAALDPYTFTRDAYLQRRHNLIHGDSAPVDEERYDLDEPESAAPPPAGAQ